MSPSTWPMWGQVALGVIVAMTIMWVILFIIAIIAGLAGFSYTTVQNNTNEPYAYQPSYTTTCTDVCNGKKMNQ